MQEHAWKLSRPELEALCPGLTTKFAEGLAAADAGQLSDGDDFFDELEREEAERRAKDRRTA